MDKHPPDGDDGSASDVLVDSGPESSTKEG